MTALLARAAQTFSVRARPASRPLVDGCAPDCLYEYLCDSSHRYYRRQCCYHPDCTRYCDAWVLIGSC
jgi:hypothetical protein